MRMFSLFLFCFLLNSSCDTQTWKQINYIEKSKDIDSLSINEGILSQHAHIINYYKNSKRVAIIKLSEPVMVAKARREEKWGFFQFPSIGRASDGTLIVSWQMTDDSHTAYGKSSVRENVPMMSKDGGRTWMLQDKDYFALAGNYFVTMKNGHSLQVYTPTTRDVALYENFPKPVGRDSENVYYYLDSLPKSLRNIYFNYFDKDGRSTSIEANLNDPGALRFAIGNSMPILWWGSIKELADNTLIAGVYPGYYKNREGQIIEAVPFYRSEDLGQTWTRVGMIPYDNDSIEKINGARCFEEPAFEILKDSTFICVMRTGSESPMYRSFSSDLGKTWSTPEPFTPNGVRPWLLRLKNGVLVLTSGRPGIQIRFSLDGMGIQWTDPIDMMPFMHHDGTYALTNTCGYTAILEDGDNSFLIVYSDFTTRNLLGQHRKTIWCRRVSVDVN